MLTSKNLTEEVRRLRRIQIEINKKISLDQFPVPIHLALGHEAVAVAVAASKRAEDQVLLSHRNVHYQLAFGATKEAIESEYSLNEAGVAGGILGSMNMMNPSVGNCYTSNILGNNLAVALGLGLAKKITGDAGIIWVVTGDGAIEEGAFYESLLIASSLKLPIIYLVENNGWSLATTIEARRIAINLEQLVNSLSGSYHFLQGNDPDQYQRKLSLVRDEVLKNPIPHLVEVELSSLGGYFTESATGESRYINYHAGLAHVREQQDDILEENTSDPLFVVRRKEEDGIV